MIKERQALKLLNKELISFEFSNEVNLFIILSLPRSDMGKGTVVAHMLNILSDSDAIKFDGLLNTNKSGRHTARGHDDFGIYEKYNPKKRFGEERYILGGYLLWEFVKKYGEYENLTFRPYMAKYFQLRVQKIWKKIGRPNNLILEIGGLIEDFEVDPYVTPAIRNWKDCLRERCKIILLTESSYNNQYVKTKNAQQALQVLTSRMLIPDFMLVRELSDLRIENENQRMQIERDITDKLVDAFGKRFLPRQVISIPFFSQDKIDNLGTYLRRRMIPFLK